MNTDAKRMHLAALHAPLGHWKMEHQELSIVLGIKFMLKELMVLGWIGILLGLPCKFNRMAFYLIACSGTQQKSMYGNIKML